jgi:hypothetical protein
MDANEVPVGSDIATDRPSILAEATDFRFLAELKKELKT